MRRALVLVALVIASLLPRPAHATDMWEQLREEPGLVVLMRHALAPGGGDPPGFRLGDCSTQRVLSAEGRAQAREIGREFRKQRVPVAGIRSSRWCRAFDTAQLLGLGAVRKSAALDSVFTAPNAVAQRKKRQTQALIRQHAGKPGVLILVGHQANIIDLTGIAPASGGAVVVRATPQGSIDVVGELTPSEAL